MGIFGSSEMGDKMGGLAAYPGQHWFLVGTRLADQRATAIMSLIQSAKLNGLDPYEYLRDVLTRLPTHKASRIAELLPHKWAGVRQG